MNNPDLMQALLGGGGGGAGGKKGGAQPQMGDFLAYLPKIMAIAVKAPAFLMGYFLAAIYLFLYHGRDSIRNEVFPQSGYHILSIFLVIAIVPFVRGGCEEATRVAHRHKSIRRMEEEIERQHSTEDFLD